MQLLIPVAAGLEGVVKKQLLSLGYGKAPAKNGRIELAGDWADVARLNVFLRSGERVLIKLKEFPAETFDELYDNFYSVPWEEWLAPDSKILMDGKSVSSRLAAIKAAGGVAKKAIVRRLADKKRSGRKTLSETAPVPSSDSLFIKTASRSLWILRATDFTNADTVPWLIPRR